LKKRNNVIKLPDILLYSFAEGETEIEKNKKLTIRIMNGFGVDKASQHVVTSQ
jgi:hypothetical protein